MSVVSSPLFRHLDQIAASRDLTPELQIKRRDTITKVKDYILNGRGFIQWFAWFTQKFVWVVDWDKQRAVIRALQEYGNLAEKIPEKDTVVDPWFLFTSFKAIDRHAELSEAFLAILNEMAKIHQQGTNVPNDYWNTKIAAMKPYCRRVHEDYVLVRDTPYSSNSTGNDYTYY